ncbi:uncharacterized protein LOC101735621 isoform X1 [Bombyx mori]|uniref:EamA domain-containing protein n=1 Tax=Bombyx mori TaxID=7091 RepID=A0A8R2GC95_BOMMO|nr:uncharacterized protein LOC101735621 isoform X1 [Bombyx mori]
MFHEAFLAGIWGSAGSALGKLAGTESVVDSNIDTSLATIAPDVLSFRPRRLLNFQSLKIGDSYAISGVILIIMVLVNTWSSRHYLRSLDAAPNSVAPTVISAASSYVLSGFIGIVLFEEPSSTQWWAGAILIIMGLTLIARPKDRDKFT